MHKSLYLVLLGKKDRKQQEQAAEEWIREFERKRRPDIVFCRQEAFRCSSILSKSSFRKFQEVRIVFGKLLGSVIPLTKVIAQLFMVYPGIAIHYSPFRRDE